MVVPLNSSDQTGTQVEAETRLPETASSARSANHLTDFFITVFPGAFRRLAHAKSNVLHRQRPNSTRADAFRYRPRSWLGPPRHLRQDGGRKFVPARCSCAGHGGAHHYCLYSLYFGDAIFFHSALRIDSSG